MHYVKIFVERPSSYDLNRPNTSFTLEKFAKVPGYCLMIFIILPTCFLRIMQTSIYLSVCEYIPCTLISVTPCFSSWISSLESSSGVLEKNNTLSKRRALPPRQTARLRHIVLPYFSSFSSFILHQISLCIFLQKRVRACGAIGVCLQPVSRIGIYDEIVSYA